MNKQGTLHRDPIIELEGQREDRDYQATINAAHSLYGSTLCPECGSDDGTIQLAWFNIPTSGQPKPPFFLKYQDRDDALYTTCWCCNPGGIIMPGYAPIKWPDALVWVEVQKIANPEEVAWQHKQRGHKTGVLLTCSCTKALSKSTHQGCLSGSRITLSPAIYLNRTRSNLGH